MTGISIREHGDSYASTKYLVGVEELLSDIIIAECETPCEIEEWIDHKAMKYGLQTAGEITLDPQLSIRLN